MSASPRGIQIADPPKSTSGSPLSIASTRSAQPRSSAWPEHRRERATHTSGRRSATCVTAASARGILKLILARCRVLTCVRPHDATRYMPQGPYGVRGSGPNQRRVLNGTLLQAGSCDPVSRPLRQTAPCPSYAPTPSRLTLGLRRCSRSSVVLALHHQGPDNARHLVGQCHSHQHRRLARQHPGQPGA